MAAAADPLPLPPSATRLWDDALDARLADLSYDCDEWVAECVAECGPTFRQRFAGIDIYNVTEPAALEWVWANEHTLFDAAWPPSLSELLGPGALVNLRGDAHREARRLLGPVFSPRALAGYFGELQRLVFAACDGWASGAPNTLDLYRAMRPLLLEVAVAVLVGEGQRPGEGAAMAERFEKFSAGIATLPLPFNPVWRTALAARASLRVSIGELMERKRSSGRLGTDALGRLLDQQGAWVTLTPREPAPSS